ncbi:hypothetical protein V490_08975 [Pseudogymnoascus sp. VKM F-3557]|nr:hypothetical protein V490_08975 [Pseudogymnoascus sp. VKM F-3557]
MSSQNFSKIKVIPNKNYQHSGPKSYVYLLQKWGFQPTLPGPYVHVEKVVREGLGFGIFRKFCGGKTRTDSGLAKNEGPEGSTAAVEPRDVPTQDIQYDSVYLSEVYIGTPPQKLMLNFDTGSADTWVWSTELPSNIQKSAGHTVFDPKHSSTFKPQKNSTWKISYGDKSSASGIVGTDNLMMGGLTIKNQAVQLANRLSSEFVGATGDGILGLAWGHVNTVTPKQVATPVANMIAQAHIPKSSELFTAYLGSWRDADDEDKGESFYTFGYIDEETVKKSGEDIYWTPIDNAQGFWMFDSQSATVNGKTVQQRGNNAIADTGTTLALVSDETCKAIYDAIPGSAYDYFNQGYIYPADTTEDQLPVVTFAVGGKHFAIQKEDLGFAPVGNGMVYGGIQSRGTMTFDILGDTFLKGMYAIFDQGNKRFGAVKRIDTTTNLVFPTQ